MEAVLEKTRKETVNSSQPSASAVAELMPAPEPETVAPVEELKKDSETENLGKIIDKANSESVSIIPISAKPPVETEKWKLEESKTREKKVEEKRDVQNKTEDKVKETKKVEVKKVEEKITETRKVEVEKAEEKREKKTTEIAGKEAAEVKKETESLTKPAEKPEPVVSPSNTASKPEGPVASPGEGSTETTIANAAPTDAPIIEDNAEETGTKPVSIKLEPASTKSKTSTSATSATFEKERPSGTSAPEGSEETKPEGEGVAAFSEKGGDSGPAEDVQAVQSLSLEGPSDKMIESYATASASQIAASYSSLGSSVTGQMGNEVSQTAKEIPPLQAQNAGTEGDVKIKIDVPAPANAEIKDGVTEADAPVTTLPPYQDLAPPVDNSKNNDKIDAQEEGGFWAWLKNSFSSFLGSVSTHDDGVNTKAGDAPKIDQSGTANPERLNNQRDEGDTQLSDEKSKTNDLLKNHPGQQVIQPVKIDEEAQVNIKEDGPSPIVTAQQDEMMQFVNMPLPGSVREAADKRMAPMLEKSLAKPRDDAQLAAMQRDEEKNVAIQNAQEETAKLNQQAQKEQDKEVEKSRAEVAGQQQEGMQEAQAKMDEFNTEANAEQESANKMVEDRVKNDQEEADKTMRTAEQDAEKEKQKGEEQAKQKKKEMEENSKNESWWDKVKGAVKSVVNALCEAIDFIFTAIRDAVKFIIEKAKNAALKLIEAGRAWIVSKLDQFGQWLKSKVNKYLSAFPALAKRINAAIDSTVNAAKAVVNAVAAKLKAGVEALANAVAGFIDSILSKFQTALKAAVQIVGAVLTGDFAEAAKIAFYAICEVAGIDPKPILDFINKAGDTIMIIFKDPVQFFKNVAGGVKKGLNQFVTNIKKHLINGLIAWLTGALSDVQITLPETFDLKGIFSLVMQILGLTYQNIRAKLVKKLGPNGEKIIGAIETSVEFIQEFITKGPIALWDRVKEFLGNLKETVIGGIRDWVITTVVKEGVIWLLSMLNPASAIVKAIKMLYDVVMFFVERWDQIVAFVQSIFNSVRELALGNLGKAANAVENALAKSVPVIISFLASLLGLGGIGKAVKKIIDKIRKPIDKGVDKVIDWLFKKGQALLGKGKSMVKKGKEAVKGLFNWWKTKKGASTKDGHKHSIYFKGKGKSAKLMIKSDEQKMNDFIDDIKVQQSLTEAQVADARKKGLEIDKEKAITPPKGKEEEQGAKIVALVDELVALVEKLPLKPSTTNTDPVYGPLRSGFGTLTKVVYIDKGHKKGTDAFSGTTPIYDIINKRMEGARKYYVRGHLLSERLGGSGTTWSNLTPLYQQANNPDMLNNFEEKVIGPVSGKGYAKDFEVKVVYGNTPDTSKISRLEDDNDDYLPPGTPPTTDPYELAEVIKNEQYVPSELKAGATVKNDKSTGNEYKVSHVVKNKSNVPYSLDPQHRTTYIISNEIAKLNRKNAIAKLSKLKMVGDERAAQAFDGMAKPGLKTYLGLFGITKKTLEKHNKTYRFKIEP